MVKQTTPKLQLNKLQLNHLIEWLDSHIRWPYSYFETGWETFHHSKIWINLGLILTCLLSGMFGYLLFEGEDMQDKLSDDAINQC